jgi:hypothetical protein
MCWVFGVVGLLVSPRSDLRRIHINRSHAKVLRNPQSLRILIDGKDLLGPTHLRLTCVKAPEYIDARKLLGLANVVTTAWHALELAESSAIRSR